MLPQVLRVMGRDVPDAVRKEIPYALRRPQKPMAPAMDAAGLARHLSVDELQVQLSARWFAKSAVPKT